MKNRRNPGKLRSYFYTERVTLLIVGITGIIYNIGMTAGPWFEGKLAGYLCDIIGGTRKAPEMLVLAFWYVLVIGLVQAMRYFKRLYVRKFANNISREMKETLYDSLIHKERRELEQENKGALMTKAISDVDACVEGMRKFTTEVFDTGVVMVAYFVMLLVYDWRLTLLVMLFPPIAYVLAERLKKIVTESVASSKESVGRLNAATLDRVSNAMTYRVYGQERNQNAAYESYLADYERKSIRANLWETSMQPLYQIISMIGTVFILWLGGRNVLGIGWKVWDVAAFSTFLSCFMKLAVKSSKAAKLFNAVQKARVSWKRIHPFIEAVPKEAKERVLPSVKLRVENLEFHYPDCEPLFQKVSFEMWPGQIFGVTGEVACGKSTLGKVFLCEYPYSGQILYGGQELAKLMEKPGQCVVGYLGHQPELFSGSIEENIRLGREGELWPVLRAVCMEQEVEKFPEGLATRIGNGGVRLSGGQQARIALARTLFHPRPLLILDDPFSAVDQKTEREILKNLREIQREGMVLLISHRLTLFGELDGVLWMEKGSVEASNHEALLACQPAYRKLYQIQTGGEEHEA